MTEEDVTGLRSPLRYSRVAQVVTSLEEAMGYEVHIYRTQVPGKGIRKITPSEWRRVMESDPEFEVSGEFCGQPLFRWKTHPEGPEFVFMKEAGSASVGVLVDEAIIGMMLEIARKLGAEVRGDEGELYRLNAEGKMEYRDD
jgi:hypothetical protein